MLGAILTFHIQHGFFVPMGIEFVMMNVRERRSRWSRSAPVRSRSITPSINAASQSLRTSPNVVDAVRRRPSGDVRSRRRRRRRGAAVSTSAGDAHWASSDSRSRTWRARSRTTSESLGLRVASTQRFGSPRSVPAGGDATRSSSCTNARALTRVRDAGSSASSTSRFCFPTARRSDGSFRHLSEIGAYAGMSDHLVSEALYLTDPDGLGIEVYADRPRDAVARTTAASCRWRRTPLDVQDLVAAGGDGALDGDA